MIVLKLCLLLFVMCVVVLALSLAEVAAFSDAEIERMLEDRNG